MAVSYTLVIGDFLMVFNVTVAEQDRKNLLVKFRLSGGPSVGEAAELVALRTIPFRTSVINSLETQVRKIFRRKIKVEVIRGPSVSLVVRKRPDYPRLRTPGHGKMPRRSNAQFLQYKKGRAAPPRLSASPFEAKMSMAPMPGKKYREEANADEPAQSKFVEYDVFYGTNRLKTARATSVARLYSNTRNKNGFTVGVCRVSIPLDRKVGSLPRPGWFEHLLFGESQEKHFKLLSINEYPEDLFLDALKLRLSKSRKGDALLFIHGYNNRYDDAILRTAQLGYDLNFKGAVIAFSWPSKGRVKSYLSDQRLASLSSDALKLFLELIIAKGGIKTLHVVAHSMGNLVLSHALLALKAENKYPLPEVKQIILAAPDIDQETFKEIIYPKIYSKKKPPRFTIYASSSDKALTASEYIHEAARIGYGGDKLMVVDGFESIDASRVDTDFLGHGYFSSTSTLIQDIHSVLSGQHPNERVFLDGFTRVVEGRKKHYWVLRMT